MTSFFKDIDFLLDQTIEKTEENITFLPEIAVMGMFDPEVEDKKRKRAIEIKKQVFYSILRTISFLVFLEHTKY